MSGNGATTLVLCEMATSVGGDRRRASGDSTWGLTAARPAGQHGLPWTQCRRTPTYWESSRPWSITMNGAYRVLSFSIILRQAA